MIPLQAEDAMAETSEKLKAVTKGVPSTPSGVSRTMLNFLIDASLLFGTINVAAMLPLGGSACGGFLCGCNGEGLR